jgi:hypothetical protein
MLEFIKELDENVKAIRMERIDQNLARANECAELIGKNIGNKRRLEHQIESMGIELTFPFEYHLSLGRFSTKNGSRNSFSIYPRFNGVILSKAMLTDEGLKKLREEYARLLERKKVLEIEEHETALQIKENQRKLKHAILRRTKADLNDRIEDENEKLSIIKSQKNDEERVRKMLEVVENLSPEQKQIIIKYLDVSAALLDILRVIDSYKKTNSDITSSRYDDEIIPEAFMRIINQKGMTRENVIGIFNMFKRVEKKVENQAYSRQPTDKKDFKVENYRKVIEGFLKYVYDPEKPVASQEFLRRFDTPAVDGPENQMPEQPEGEEH